MKGFVLRLVLKQRRKRTRKWPIVFSSEDLGLYQDNTIWIMVCLSVNCLCYYMEKV